MILKKSWLSSFVLMTTVLLLAGCGSKDAATDNPVSNGGGPQDGSPDDIVFLSDALEQYPVWFETSDEPGRKSYVSVVYVFEDDKATEYRNLQDLIIDDIHELTDEEVINFIDERAEMKIEGEYSIDITLDQAGQNTEEVKIMWHDAVRETTYEAGYNLDGEILEEETVFTSEMEEGDTVVRLDPQTISQTIYETKYAGFQRGESDSFVTRVEDSFADFKLDSPDTEKENVTIEEYQ